jgi:hypothetical protein
MHTHRYRSSTALFKGLRNFRLRLNTLIHTHTHTHIHIHTYIHTYIHTESHAYTQCIVAAQRYLRDCATSDSDSTSHKTLDSDSDSGAHKRATGVDAGEHVAASRHAETDRQDGHRMRVRMIRDMLFGRLSVCLYVCLSLCLSV